MDPSLKDINGSICEVPQKEGSSTVKQHYNFIKIQKSSNTKDHPRKGLKINKTPSIWHHINWILLFKNKNDYILKSSIHLLKLKEKTLNCHYLSTINQKDEHSSTSSNFIPNPETKSFKETTLDSANFLKTPERTRPKDEH